MRERQAFAGGVPEPVLAPVLAEDVAACARRIDLARLAGRTVLVTGATGLLGRMLVLVLLRADRIAGLNLRVLATARDSARASALFGGAEAARGPRIVAHDLRHPLEPGERADYVLHCAAPTQSRFFVERPLETIAAIVDGTRHVLEYAAKSEAVSVVHLSSMEIYGVVAHPDVAEEDCGHLDPMQARSSYPEAKRLAECLCGAYFRQRGLPVKVARLTQTFGAGVRHDDPRVFAEFARHVLEGRDIVLRTAGETRRAYCYTTDAVAALLTILLRGENGRAYNVANRATYASIREVAEAMAGAGKGIRVRMEPGAEGLYPPATAINLKTDAVEALGWQPAVGMAEMVARLLAGMGEEEGAKGDDGPCRC